MTKTQVQLPDALYLEAKRVAREREMSLAEVIRRGVEDVAICDLVLVELYLLLRNPVVVSQPLAAHAAAPVCRSYRINPNW